MDPFTQRMLERAKLRREKLDVHLSREPMQKLPLQESNTLNIDNNVNKNNAINLGKSEPAIKQIEVGKSKGKSNRLAELASKINQWEDDLSHPRRHSADEENNKQQKVQQPVASKSTSVQAENKSEKQVVWDQSILKKLESQGFSRSPSQSKLMYNFEANKTKKESTPSPRKSPRYSGSKTTKGPYSKSPNNNLDTRSPIRELSSYKSPNSPRMGIGSLKDSSVMKKAALFESNIKSSPSKQVKDPTELPVSERKALFEKNKGVALIPRVAFATSLPAKMRVEKKPATTPNVISPKKMYFGMEAEPKVELSDRSWLNRKGNPAQKEKNLWKKQEATKVDEPKIPVSAPCAKPLAPVVPVVTVAPAAKIIEATIPPPPPPPSTPPAPLNYQDSPETLKAIKEVKKIHFSPGKTGKLYPSLSDIEGSDESDHASSEEAESFNESKNSNIYLNMSFSDIIEASKNNPVTPPTDRSFSRSTEREVLNEMDELLDEALGDVSSSVDEEDAPTPPKMSKSTSFVYQNKPEQTATTPLVHTVSFYRKQQQNSAQLSTPVAVIKRDEKTPEKTKEDETVLVERKIQNLLDEINKQQTIISQASQALNLCLSTVEFSGSGEQVEGERLLLLASHKRQACLNEIQRLKVENSIRPQGSNSQLTERGDVTITNITVPLKREALRSMAADESMLYLVCLVKSDERVLATSGGSATREHLSNMALTLPGQIKLEKLLSDFKVTIEVYNMTLSKEMLPHDVKYHINNRKEKKLLTPIKAKKNDSKLVMPCVQSPAGPNAVRTSNFQMCGYVVFSLREVTRTQWTLNKVPYTSPLEGSISMKIQSELQLDSEFRGFLTMFDDISGFGAWHRRWCLLSSHTLSYWKYPDDENKKVPMGTIDLKDVVTKDVGVVLRDICARLHTFLLETTRPRQEDDKDSLVLNVCGDTTRIRHLLSADSKSEMLVWCQKLNTTLALLRAWGCNAAC